MNIKQIKALAQILAQNDLSALEINEGETHIRLERTVAQSGASRRGIGRAAHAGGGRAERAGSARERARGGSRRDFQRRFRGQVPWSA